MESPRDHGRGSKHEALASSGQSCLIHRGSPNLPGGMGTPQGQVFCCNELGLLAHRKVSGEIV